MLNVRLAGDHMGNSCSPAVAGDVFDGVSLCCLFFPRDVFDEIWDLIESVSEGFPTYSHIHLTILFPNNSKQSPLPAAAIGKTLINCSGTFSS